MPFNLFQILFYFIPNIVPNNAMRKKKKICLAKGSVEYLYGSSYVYCFPFTNII